MKVQALWHGGTDHVLPGPQDVEQFSSKAIADRVFLTRYEYNTSTPCVGADCTMQLFYDQAKLTDSSCPDEILSIGPKGEIVRSPA